MISSKLNTCKISDDIMVVFVHNLLLQVVGMGQYKPYAEYLLNIPYIKNSKSI